MKARTKRKVRAGMKTILKFLGNAVLVVADSRSDAYRRLYHPGKYNFDFSEELWKEYTESSLRDGVDKLLRKGMVNVVDTPKGKCVHLTEFGLLRKLVFNIDDMKIQKVDKWDGKWRMVFFDVEEVNRSRRDILRRWITKLGLRRMQKSVFIYPYPLENEIKYIREVLGVPHVVKLVVAEYIENDEDLREWFDL